MARWLRPRAALAALIKIYQKLVSANTSPNCRYQPTCSGYTLEGGREVWRVFVVGGSGIKRIGRCHPLRPGGF